MARYGFMIYIHITLCNKRRFKKPSCGWLKFVGCTSDWLGISSKFIIPAVTFIIPHPKWRRRTLRMRNVNQGLEKGKLWLDSR